MSTPELWPHTRWGPEMSGSNLCKKERKKWDGDKNILSFSSQNQAMVFILEKLALRYGDLAKLVNCDRLTISKWFDGAKVPLSGQQRLNELLEIASQVEKCDFKNFGHLIHFAIFEKEYSLFDLIYLRRDISGPLQKLKEIDNRKIAVKPEVKGSGKNLCPLNDVLDEFGFIGGLENAN